MVLNIVIIEVSVILMIVALVIFLVKRKIRKDKEWEDGINESISNICDYSEKINELDLKLFDMYIKTGNHKEVDKFVNRMIDENNTIKEALVKIDKDKLKYKL